MQKAKAFHKLKATTLCHSFIEAVLKITNVFLEQSIIKSSAHSQ